MSPTDRCRVEIAVVFSATFLAYGCDSATTLQDLARRGDVRVELTVERDQCLCPCDQIVCWRFSCDAPGCSIADEYELRMRYPPESSATECPEIPPGLTATLIASDGAPLASSSEAGCGHPRFTWRVRRGEFNPALSHRIETTDETARWTIDGGFTPRSMTIVAPPTAATPEAGAARVVPAGAQLLVGVSPPAPGLTAKATIRSRASSPTQAPSALPIAAIDDDSVALSIPPTTAPGLHDISTSIDAILPPDQCRGPSVCDGVGAWMEWQVRVE